ncbi:MAG: hypothetical protein V3V11_04365, partial [Vicinamibacteria bacterium]
ANLNGHEGGNAGDGQGAPKATKDGGKPLAEGMERRGRAKGNAKLQTMRRTRSRERVQSARARIGQVAKDVHLYPSQRLCPSTQGRSPVQ